MAQDFGSGDSSSPRFSPGRHSCAHPQQQVASMNCSFSGLPPTALTLQPHYITFVPKDLTKCLKAEILLLEKVRKMSKFQRAVMSMCFLATDFLKNKNLLKLSPYIQNRETSHRLVENICNACNDKGLISRLLQLVGKKHATWFS